MNLQEKISSIRGEKVREIVEDGNGGIRLLLSNSTKILASYWRVCGSSEKLSSFDHGQQYGLEKPINAPLRLNEILKEKQVQTASFIEKSGDIELVFENNLLLQIMNLSHYEVWEIEFSDGSGEISNYT